MGDSPLLDHRQRAAHSTRIVPILSNPSISLGLIRAAARIAKALLDLIPLPCGGPSMLPREFLAHATIELLTVLAEISTALSPPSNQIRYEVHLGLQLLTKMNVFRDLIGSWTPQSQPSAN